MLTTAEVALTFDADVAGGRLHGWLGICPEPPVLVATRQNHPRTALLGRLEHPMIADTGFGEAFGAGLFVFEPVVIESLRDAGESAARALCRGPWGMKCVSRGVCAVAG